MLYIESLLTLSIIYFIKCNTRSRNQQNIVNCIQYFLKAQPEDGYIETSRNM